MAISKNKLIAMIAFFIFNGIFFSLANTYLKGSLFLIVVVTFIASFLLYFVVFGFQAHVKSEAVKSYRAIALVFGFLAMVNTLNYFTGTKDKLPFLLLYWFVAIINTLVYFKNKPNRIH
jgi:hypothetical protein